MSIFKIQDGRRYLYQWDIDRYLIVDSDDDDIVEVHFSYGTSGNAYKKNIEEQDGIRVVQIPQILLEQHGMLKIYAYGANHTQYFGQVEVRERAKPDDYVYTEEERKVWDNLVDSISNHSKRLENLEDRLSSSAFLVDDDLGFYKYIPDNVCPYAQINYIGGMTSPRTDLEPFLKEDTWFIALGYDTGEWEKYADIPQEIQDLEGYGYGLTSTNKTVHNYIDLNTKEFVQTCKLFTFDGTESWTDFTDSNGNAYYRINNWALPSGTYYAGALRNGKAISNLLPRALIKNGIDAFTVTSHLNCIYTGCADRAEWRAFLKEQYANGTPFQVLAELTTPIRTDISKWLNLDNIVDIRGQDYFYFSGFNELSPIPTSITYLLKEE